MPFNRVQLAARIQNFLSNPSYYQSIDFNDSIQDGFDEIAAVTGVIYNQAVVPFTALTSYYDMLSLLPDYIGVVAVFNSAISRWMIPTSLTKLNQARWDWEVAGGTPYWYVPVNHRYMAIYMKPLQPAYGNMYVFYRASAPVLQDSTNIAIPDDHIQALENYVLTDLWEQNQEFSKASDYLQTSYLPDIENLRVYIQNRRDPDRQIRLMG